MSRWVWMMILPILAWCATFQPIEEKRFTFDTLSWYKIENLQVVTQKNGVFFRLIEEKPTANLTEDLLLDFETRRPLLKNYHITYENYIPNPFHARSGQTSAKFFTKNHSLRLLPKSSALFRPGSIPGSFTIEYWSYFHQIYEGQSIVEFVGNNLGDENDQNTYGFRIVVKKNRLTYIFENFFWDGEESYSFEISEDHPLLLNRWEHHAVSFNILDGRLVTWRGGIEQQTLWVTKNRRPRSTIFIPKVKEEIHASLVIGKGGFFSMDNFAILPIFKEQYAIQNYRQKPAELVSTVYKMPVLFEIKSLELLAKLPKEPFLVKIAYRLSNEPFPPSDTSLSWVYLPSQANTFPFNMTIGKYIQFKIQYFPYEANEESFLFSGISLRYTVHKRPLTPVILSSEAGDTTITLSWLPSPEESVVGYEIYYGHRSQEYLGEESINGKSPVFVPYTHGGKLKAITYTLQGLRNDTPYFVTVVAVDKWGQRSEFSQEIVLFPSDIHNQKRYSVK